MLAEAVPKRTMYDPKSIESPNVPLSLLIKCNFITFYRTFNWYTGLVKTFSIWQNVFFSCSTVPFLPLLSGFRFFFCYQAEPALKDDLRKDLNKMHKINLKKIVLYGREAARSKQQHCQFLSSKIILLCCV